MAEFFIYFPAKMYFFCFFTISRGLSFIILSGSLTSERCK